MPKVLRETPHFLLILGKLRQLVSFVLEYSNSYKLTNSIHSETVIYQTLEAAWLKANGKFARKLSNVSKVSSCGDVARRSASLPERQDGPTMMN